MEAITDVCFSDFVLISRRQGACYDSDFCDDELDDIDDDVAFRAQFDMDGLRLGFCQRFYRRSDFDEDVEGGFCGRFFFRRICAFGRIVDSERLFRDFLIRRGVVVAFFMRRLVEAAFCACVFRFFASIRAAFRCVSICRVFRFYARRDISFAQFCVRRIGTRVRFTVRASDNSSFGILDVGRGLGPLLLYGDLVCSLGAIRGWSGSQGGTGEFIWG